MPKNKTEPSQLDADTLVGRHLPSDSPAWVEAMRPFADGIKTQHAWGMKWLGDLRRAGVDEATLTRLNTVSLILGFVGVPQDKLNMGFGQANEAVNLYCIKRAAESPKGNGSAEELCTMAVAVKDFHVSRATVRRAVKEGKLKDHRRAGGRKNATLLLDRSELIANFPRKS